MIIKYLNKLTSIVSYRTTQSIDCVRVIKFHAFVYILILHVQLLTITHTAVHNIT